MCIFVSVFLTFPICFNYKKYTPQSPEIFTGHKNSHPRFRKRIVAASTAFARWWKKLHPPTWKAKRNCQSPAPLLPRVRTSPEEVTEKLALQYFAYNFTWKTPFSKNWWFLKSSHREESIPHTFRLQKPIFREDLLSFSLFLFFKRGVRGVSPRRGSGGRAPSLWWQTFSIKIKFS